MLKRTGDLWVLFWAQAILVFGLALSFPFLALYLSQERGMPMSQVGLVMSLTLFGAAFSHALGGELSDSIGRRPVMVASLWIRTALVLTLAECIRSGRSLGMIMALYVAAAFFGEFFTPSARSWIADHYTHGQRVQAYGFLRVAINLGWGLGPAVGGFMATRSYAALFFATAMLCAVAACVLTLRIRDKHLPADAGNFSWQASFRAFEDRRFLLFCVSTFLIGSVMGHLVVPVSVYAVRHIGLSEPQVGLLFSINGLIVVATQVFVSKLLSKHPITSALTLGSLLYAFGYGVGVGFASGFAAMALAILVVSLGEVTVSPGLQALAANMAPRALKGRYMGVSGFVHQAGFAASPLLGGWAIEFLCPHWLAAPWVLIGVVGLLAALGFHRLRGTLRADEEGLVERDFPTILEAI